VIYFHAILIHFKNQEHLHPRLRIKRYPTPEEFWASEEEFNFRIICSDYAEFRKFKKWVTAKVFLLISPA